MIVQITNDLLDKKPTNKPSRFDMAINFYCCLKKDNKHYLVTYYYNPAWNLYYPFYDDIHKTPITHNSKSNTYGELIEETNKILGIDLEEKLNLAHKRFIELIGCDCKVVPSKTKELYELKYSKTANTYSLYKLYNFIITEVEDLNKVLNPQNLKCKIFDIENLDSTKVVSNAIWFCKESIAELKQYALHIT
jgi:hypothetical protein